MYTHHEEVAFTVNILFLALALVPKIPLFDRVCALLLQYFTMESFTGCSAPQVRIFNINKY